jgi:hypothetical protein
MKFVQVKNRALSNKINKESLEDITLYKKIKKWDFKELADHLIYFRSDKKIKKLDGAVIDRVINILFDLKLNQGKA